ncbi:MAG: hypothetical protein WAZ77_11220 [Candidatus Nitrosopolaris sp.]
MTSNDDIGNKDTSSSPSQNVHDLQAKLDKLRNTIFKFSKIEKETHRSVRQQLSEIIDDGKRLNIDIEELRRMLNETLCSGAPRAEMISRSYLRRLLPPEYKNSSKARLDYKVKQNVEQLEQVGTDSLKEIQKQVTATVKEQDSEELQRLTTENKQQEEDLQSLRNGLDTPKEGEIWTATGILDISGNQIPLKITVNTKQKQIEHVEIDRESMKNAMPAKT